MNMEHKPCVNVSQTLLRQNQFDCQIANSPTKQQFSRYIRFIA